jgi:hypothetical protein
MGAVGEYIIIGCLVLYALVYLGRRILLRIRAVKENDVCKNCSYSRDSCGKSPDDCR